ncbi:MAG: tRNA (adenosine(37)-N6)-dimethylallyltransferase MiaA [Clostridiales bacterium]|nr:tRNA (adenosine(37)-N6)-dimethylallyltransferase MiaA [Clostridiales bacterium]
MRPLVILTGPTAVGKTKLSIELAKAINAEIISADSMQVYKYMDIGTAKIRPEEMEGVKHYLVDEFEPDDDFNVVKFQEYTKRYMEDIYSRGKIPLIVGGTGFYIQAIIKDVDFTENDADMTYRHELEALAKEKGATYLHNMLKEVDEASAIAIHENNVKKVIRALEFYQQTGTKISEHNLEQSERTSPYDFTYFVLNDDREKLYERIDLRIDEMLEEGLIEEVKHLREMGYSRDLVSMQGLGYKEILAYLEGECTLEEAVYILKRDTRHFAKRQLTWFRREKNVTWVDKQKYNYNTEQILEFMLEKLAPSIGKELTNERTI